MRITHILLNVVLSLVSMKRLILSY